jgi:hypothetical protein
MATTKKTAETTTAAKNMTADMMSFGNGAEWAENAKEQFETMMSSFTGNFDDLRTQGEEFAETAQARLKAVQERAAKNNARLMEVAQEDMTTTVQFASDLGKAKTFADALSVQQSFWTNMFETRMERTREMTEAAAEAAREVMTPAEMPFANTKMFEKFFAFPAKA